MVVSASSSRTWVHGSAPTDLRWRELLPLLESLAEDLARRWRSGERPLVEEHLARHPELLEQPEAVLELIADEIFLRTEAGLDVAAAELVQRFPQWRRQVLALLDCHQLLSTEIGPPRFPTAGDTLEDFRLLAELGRGAHGRVFLATQPALADRPVVLKLTANVGREHLSLSRLQHTNIVPLCSVHDFVERGLRGLCQPYFGGATLAELLHDLEPIPCAERTGRDVLRVLEQRQARSATVIPVKGPACRFLARASYVQAVCWLGACLADGLHHAHERGLLHLDLKPSNVLLAADGQPMLLDFHLARAPLSAGAAAPESLGGTPGYMAPEQVAALIAVTERQQVPAAVNAPADLYSLAVLLSEALAKEGPPQELRRRNPHVPVGLADVLARCQAPDPRHRYATAADLATDLRRHLADLPLRGVTNRSLVERWRKWRRRQPHALPLLVLVLACVLTGSFLFAQGLRQTHAASAAWELGEDHLRQHRYAEAREAFRSGAALTEDLPFVAELRDQLRRGAEQAERGQAAEELHRFCEQVRPLYGADFLTAEQARTVAEHCREFWQKREVLVPPEGEPQIQNDLLDLAILWVNLRVRLAPPDEAPKVRQEALNVLAEAEALLGPSCVLYHERSAIAQALGLTKEAETAARQGASLAPRTSWEHYALGRSYLRAGELGPAATHLERALELQPQGLWPHFYKGVCAYRLGQYEEALLAFTACVALSPHSAVCFYNRGRAFAELRRLDRALEDYDRAAQLDPALVAASLGQADVHRQLQRYEDALADLDRATRAGADGAVVAYQQALIHLGRQDKAAAVESLRHALRRDPHHEPARELLKKLAQPH
jgi:serine/threonine protein kinase/tetratricopeptide (TPR) repeat protein